MTVRLRPHHLLCMLTYVGKGYSPAFTANYDVIAGRLGSGETIVVVEGPDDICTPLLDSDKVHCHGASVRARDATAAGDIADLLGRPVGPGVRIEVTADLTSRLRKAFVSKRIRAACGGCEWSDLCSAVAEEGFKGVRIVPECPVPAALNLKRTVG